MVEFGIEQVRATARYVATSDGFRIVDQNLQGTGRGIVETFLAKALVGGGEFACVNRLIVRQGIAFDQCGVLRNICRTEHVAGGRVVFQLLLKALISDLPGGADDRNGNTRIALGEAAAHRLSGLAAHLRDVPRDIGLGSGGGFDYGEVSSSRAANDRGSRGKASTQVPTCDDRHSTPPRTVGFTLRQAGVDGNRLSLLYSRKNAIPTSKTIMKMTVPVVAEVKLSHIFSRSAVKASMVSGPVKRDVPWLAMISLG
jgi:hypothetical protein